MTANFVQLKINGVMYDAVLRKGMGNCEDSFRVTGEQKPIIGAFARPVIYVEWIKQAWFKKAVPDFKIFV